jgi:hypothetical protein
MAFNTILNNISAVLWQSVLLVEETGEIQYKPDNLCRGLLLKTALVV